MILKLNSVGEEVKILQRFLVIDDDGIFGPDTEKAVKKWQKKYKLDPDGVVGKNTITKMGLVFPEKQQIINTTDIIPNCPYTISQIKKSIINKGYKWFDSTKDYELNIIGIRNLNVGRSVTNIFDDYLILIYKEKGNLISYCWEFTTDPGKKAMLEVKEKKGVAILVPNQYLNSYVIGLHKGTYLALRQNKPLKVYRDKNKDMSYNLDTIDEGIFGINIHKAGIDTTYVENWSEGCQVFKKQADFNQFMLICKKASELNGNLFTYTLINSTDINKKRLS